MAKILIFFSSGSITDSICTAYENSSMVTSGISKAENVELILKEADETCDEIILPKKNFEEMLEGTKNLFFPRNTELNFNFSHILFFFRSH